MWQQYVGEISGVLAALSWAGASLVFSRAPIRAAALNFFKNSLSTLLLFGTLAVGAVASGAAIFHYAPHAWCWLALSAVSGLFIGDYCYFRCIQILGPRRALLVAMTVPPLGAVSGWFFLGEAMDLYTAVGMMVTLNGIAWVIRERTVVDERPGLYPGSARRGLAFGLSAALCQALGAAFSKLGMNAESFPGIAIDAARPELAALEASFLRIGCASLCGLALGLMTRELASWARSLRPASLAFRVSAAALVGTYGGIWLSLTAFKYAPVAVATTCTSLAPVFVLPLVRYCHGTRVSWRAVAGALIALAGVWIVSGGGRAN
ncbi:MAG: DMT family transporter [Planctomycetota bacterium]